MNRLNDEPDKRNNEQVVTELSNWNIIEDYSGDHYIRTPSDLVMSDVSDKDENQQISRPCNILLISNNVVSFGNLSFLLSDLFNKYKFQCVFNICIQSDVLKKLREGVLFDILFLPRNSLQDPYFFQAYSTSSSRLSPIIVLNEKPKNRLVQDPLVMLHSPFEEYTINGVPVQNELFPPYSVSEICVFIVRYVFLSHYQFNPIMREKILSNLSSLVFELQDKPLLKWSITSNYSSLTSSFVPMNIPETLQDIQQDIQQETQQDIQQETQQDIQQDIQQEAQQEDYNELDLEKIGLSYQGDCIEEDNTQKQFYYLRINKRDYMGDSMNDMSISSSLLPPPHVEYDPSIIDKFNNKDAIHSDCPLSNNIFFSDLFIKRNGNKQESEIEEAKETPTSTFRHEFNQVIQEAKENGLLIHNQNRIPFSHKSRIFGNEPEGELHNNNSSEASDLVDADRNSVSFLQKGKHNLVNTQSLPLLKVRKVEYENANYKNSSLCYSLNEKELKRLCMRFHSLPITSDQVPSLDQPAIILSENNLPPQYYARQRALQEKNAKSLCKRQKKKKMVSKALGVLLHSLFDNCEYYYPDINNIPFLHNFNPLHPQGD